MTDEGAKYNNYGCISCAAGLLPTYTSANYCFAVIFFFYLQIPLCSCYYYMKNNTYLYPANMFSRVLFPAPDGPNIAVRCPERKSPLTLRRINFEPGD